MDPGIHADSDAGKVQFGLKWTALSMVLFRFARLGTTIVLARILTKPDFGLVTMAMAFIMAFQALRDIGFGPAFVQRKDLDAEEEQTFTSTMFWVVGAINVVMFLVGYAMAPYAATYFDKLDGLAPILQGVFCLLLIEALSTVPTAILQKRLEFGMIATGEMVGIVLHTVLSIALALLGFGAWSIVLGTLGSRLAQTLLVVRMSGWRPTRTFSAHAAKELFGFGRYLWGNSLLGASSKVVDKMVVGKILGDTALGYYGNAYNLCTTASKPIFSIILRVTFPALSRIQDDAPAIRRAILTAITSVSLVTVPLSFGLSAVATDFVTVVYGPSWAPMGPIVQILAAYGIVASVGSITSPILMATGRVRNLFYYSLLGQALMVALFLWFGRYDAVGIACGLLGATFSAELFAFCFAMRSIGLPLRQGAAPIARSLAAATIMYAAVLVTERTLATLTPLQRLPISVLVGILTYAAATFLLNRRAAQTSLKGVKGVLLSKGRLA
ncbi:Teichuronic acid biosynthesis protein TuaB [Planctomycetes bacterium Poly30]|uniref:Teichuronic acid biosynthesis protein TuaB n=1 Tax=Saltatorellus ferox TaxID=2528018 RepID=A0A518EQH2_9BACT|nr:Teichuronic acid biosynthesis protein TuaB [Planctomycetes bacterium Poly30]